MSANPNGSSPTRRIGLRTLFMLTVTVVLITTSGLLGWLLIRDRAQYLQSDLEAKGVSLALTLASHAEYGVLVGDREGLGRLIEGLKHDADLSWAAVTDTDGIRLASGPADRPQDWQTAHASEIERLPGPARGVATVAPSPAALSGTPGGRESGRENGRESGRENGRQSGRENGRASDGAGERISVRHLSSPAGDWVQIQAPVTTVPVVRSREDVALAGHAARSPDAPRERIGTVTLVLSRARIEAALSSARRMVGWVTLLVVALGILLAVPLAYVIVRPVEHLVLASRRITEGELEVQVLESSSRELADLARAFNRMTASLRERDQRLNENAGELERRAEALHARQVALEAANEALVELNQELRLSQQQLWASNAELLHTSGLKSAFLASMSHELRTPLNSIIGYTECMIDGLDGPINAEQQESLERVQRNGRHLLGLINDILDLSKIEAGQVELSISSLSPGELAEECLAMIRPLVRSKPVELKLEIEGPLPSMQADAARIRQVLINLLSNGAKFTDAGELTLRVQGVGDGIELAVRDTGRGIPADKLEEIFLEFRQLEGPTTAGTGLGLAITKRLVELMSGTIRVESQVGVGSTFVVWLPRAVGKA